MSPNPIIYVIFIHMQYNRLYLDYIFIIVCFKVDDARTGLARKGHDAKEVISCEVVTSTSSIPDYPSPSIIYNLSWLR